MNTKICYLYRDAGNYKVHNECVIQGELSKEQIQSNGFQINIVE